MDRLAGSVIFTTWDLTSGYWQMLMADSNKEKTAFSTPDGHYQFIRMPFGLKNAPAEFSRLMHQVLGDLTFVEIYLDDITIHTKTLEEHIEHIEIAAQRLREANLKLNGSKCTWMAKQVKLLGFLVSKEGVAMDPDKVEAISNRTPPKDVKGVQVWLGICNYYRRHVKDFAKIASPLVDMLRKDAIFKWGKDEQESFKKLKQGLVSYPVLKHPDFARQFIISTDASGFAMGAVLAQIDDNKTEYAVAYASRSLKGAELNYHITEQECLAVVWAIKQFRVYVYGTKFKVITDHAALAWLMNIVDPTARLARWSIYLQAYEFEIIHRKGIKHTNADTLSRPVMVITRSASRKATETAEDAQDEDLNTKLDPTEDGLLLYRLEKGKNKPGIANKHAKRLDKLSQQYKLENGTLLIRKPDSNKYLIYPRKNERNELIEKAHLLGHFQAEATFKRLAEAYFWKNMIDDITTHIEKCEECREFHKIPAIEQKAMAIPIRGIFERIGIDLVFGLPETTDGYVGLVVITEYLSKYVWVLPIKSKTGKEIAKCLLKYIGIFGPPKRILSDQGTEFNNETVRKLINLTGTEHRITSSYHPRTNGQTERFNRTMIEMLSKFTRNDNLSWPEWIPFVCFCYNTKTHTSTKYTPFELMFGRKANNFSNFQNTGDMDLEESLKERGKEIRELIEVNHVKALENIQKQQERQVKTQNSSHRTTDEQLSVGTKVYVRTTGINDKLFPRYRGPFTIVEVTKLGNYIIENVLHERMADTYPRQRLKVISDKDNLDEENIMRVQKIINHREDEKGNFKYLVKLLGLSEKHNSWEPQENFFDKDQLSNYWKKQQQQVPKRRGRPVRGLSNTILMYLSLIFFISTTVAMDIMDDFYSCKVPKEGDTFLAVENGCIDIGAGKQSTNYVTKGTVYTNMNILARKSHEVHGKGWECKKELVQLKTFQNFFGANFVEEKVSTYRLTKDECEKMIDTRKCDNHDMTCQDSICMLDSTPQPSYTWMFQEVLEGVRCSIRPKIKTAIRSTDDLFGKNCKADKGSCDMGNYLIIWKEDIISKCPFNYITTSELVGQDDNILYDNKQNRAFVVVHQIVTECKWEMFQTSVGLFLTQANESTSLTQGNVDVAALHELMLSEADGTSARIKQAFMAVRRELCEELGTFFRLLKKQPDTYDTMQTNTMTQIISNSCISSYLETIHQ